MTNLKPHAEVIQRIETNLFLLNALQHVKIVKQNHVFNMFPVSCKTAKYERKEGHLWKLSAWTFKKATKILNSFSMLFVAS